MILSLKTSSLPFSLCIACFVFKFVIMWAKDLTGEVTPQWAEREALFYFIMWLYEDISIKFSKKKYILKY